MVEANEEDQFDDQNDEDAAWDDYGSEGEEDSPRTKALKVMEEVAAEKKIEENKELLDQMRKQAEEQMNCEAAKLTKWKLIPVKMLL